MFGYSGEKKIPVIHMLTKAGQRRLNLRIEQTVAGTSRATTDIARMVAGNALNP